MMQVSGIAGVLGFRDHVRFRSVARTTHSQRDLSHRATTTSPGGGRPDAHLGLAELSGRGCSFQGCPTAEHERSEPFRPASGGECYLQTPDLGPGIYGLSL